MTSSSTCMTIRLAIGHYLPIGDPLEQSLYLQPFSRYWPLSVLRSRPWHFMVTWRHRSRYHLIPRWPFPIGTPLSPSVYLQPFPRYWALSILGSRPWPFRVTWRHHVTSSVTWPFDSQVLISYRHSIVTKSLSSAISEIMGTKHGGPLDPSLYL